MNLTVSQKPTEVTRDWFVVDATDLPLGRLASVVATHLKGKHKPSFTAHVDGGDNVIIINAEKIRLTGRKMTTLTHHWHTGYVGHLRSINAETELAGDHPERVVERAVKRMMPKTKLGTAMYKKLHVYAGTQHPHEAQKPKALDVAGIIAKK
ncbi:MAG: 50S ribosomal protein L13 [Magnetococcales bacterium]|nr:50S ribosomal protein L13 [Magnetococcales bacterium]PPR19428.1 MAG: 50S ribosomal protein L13 [Pseudomonadota bacterium]|tara:strand:+ start:456 stop:911 length:456 start_codon:yes stop_codon:yes gene_type:complete